MFERGSLIVLEGCDRCGKSTQCRKLVDSLNAEGKKAQLIRFPERSTAIGKVINDYLERKCELEDHAVHLLFAANRWEAVPKMKELLESGTTLVVDRYAYSGVAFTSAKNGFDLEWCRQPDIGIPEPDAVLYLTLSPQEAAKREEFGGERYENKEFQTKVARNFELLKSQDWKMIDASKSIEDLHGEIKEIANQIILSSQNQPIKQLWVDNEDVTSAKRSCNEHLVNGTKTVPAPNGHVLHAADSSSQSKS